MATAVRSLTIMQLLLQFNKNYPTGGSLLFDSILEKGKDATGSTYLLGGTG